MDSLQVDRVAFESSWVLVYPDESLVALDGLSGGYPYRAFHLSSVMVWPSREAAERYRDMFRKDDFKLKKAFLAIQNVEE